MVTSRLFYSNFLTSITQLSTMTVTGGAVAQSAAQVSSIQVIRHGASSATLEVAGTYTSFEERTYMVEIHVVGTGAFGSAQWRWSDTGGATWNASNLTTVNGGSFISLSHGITVRWAAGPTTPQFVLNDLRIFRVTLEHGPAKVVDLSRETEYRSGTVPSSSTIEWRLDLGSAMSPTVFALLDENMPANGVVTLLADDAGFTNTDYTNVVAAGTDGRRMELITPGAFRYWRVRFTFVSAPTLGYLRFSEMFLGTVETFTTTFDIGYRDAQRVLGSVDLETAVRGPSPFMLEGRYLALHYGRVRSTDTTIFITLRDWIRDRTVRTRRPFYFVLMDSNLADFGLFHWTNDFELNHLYLETYGVDFELAEVIRTFDD